VKQTTPTASGKLPSTLFPTVPKAKTTSTLYPKVSKILLK
jgi:hypothetical protein